MTEPDMVRVNFLCPRELRDRMVSLSANEPEKYYSTSEAWVCAGEDYLLTHELGEEQLKRRKKQ